MFQTSYFQTSYNRKTGNIFSGVDGKAKAKATIFCPRAVVEVEDSPRGRRPCELSEMLQ